MAFDWLFGATFTNPGYENLRSYVLDPDSIIEIYGLLEDQTDVAHLQHNVGGPVMPHFVELPLAAFTSSADWRRQGIKILGGADGEITVDFPANGAASISSRAPWGANGQLQPVNPYDQLVRDIGLKIRKENSPRIVWQPSVPILPWLGLLLLVGSWIWTFLSSSLDLSAQVFGWLLIVAAATLTVQTSRQLAGFTLKRPGNRTRSFSRQELRNRRADFRRDAIVTGITLPLGAVLAAAAIWLFHVY